ncbi:M60 family metallopeptidase [Streptomyces sp. NBC_01304]|uniref:M60 family metallopeptidase n=1 Tax=Streptomyces sp. NBC_01304 TaxID=2903818 RepID=UPI002E1530C4|nr:M60 family metallopeptidase [Streptomyces sp. NBC_01304]
MTVTLGEAAHPIPYYVLGETTNEQWRAMLAASASPYAQLESGRVFLTVTRKTALKHVGASQDELLKTYDALSEAEDAIGGVGNNAAGAVPSSPLRQQIVEYRANGSANAGDHRVAWPTNWSSEALLTAKGLNTSWGMWHEMGHQRQMAKWSWDAMQELTVNIYALAADRRLPGTQNEHATPEEWQNALAYLSLPYTQRDWDDAGGDEMQGSEYHFGRFTMLEQLRLLFGDAFYHRLHAVSRPTTPQAAGSNAARKRLFMVQASKAAGRDLTGYFTAWGLRPDSGTRQGIAALKLPKAPTDWSRIAVYSQGQQLANAATGQCLTAGAPRGAVTLAPCRTTATQQWSLTAASGGTQQLVNSASRQCLAVPNASARPGTGLLQMPCGRGADRQWRLGTTSDGQSHHELLSNPVDLINAVVPSEPCFGSLGQERSNPVSQSGVRLLPGE